MESQEIDQELGLGLSDSPFKESHSYIFPYQSSDNCTEKTRVFLKKFASSLLLGSWCFGIEFKVYKREQVSGVRGYGQYPWLYQTTSSLLLSSTVYDKLGFIMIDSVIVITFIIVTS